mgnify:CR=1 FL=1
MSTRPADYAVLGTSVSMLLVVIGMGIGEDRALRDLSAKCLPQPGESRLLAVVQATKPEPSVTCIFEYSAPHKAVVKRKATKA